ncbi:MAG: hypothetical protein QW416_01440 [Candidatus Nitrosocaldaceae archaeon]
MEYIISITLTSTIISMLIAISAYKGYSLLKSPTLLRLFLAFSFISCGFLILSFNIFINTLIISLIFHIIGYFLLSFSYSIQSLQFKHMIPAIALISIALSPLIIIPGDSLEHIIRSISFVLIVYGSTNAFVAYMMKKNVNTLMTSNGLALLAFGEFIGWYGFIYPQSFFYELSLTIKMLGLSVIMTPIYLKISGVRNGV